MIVIGISSHNRRSRSRFVIYLPQNQPMRGRRHARHLAVLARQHLAYASGGELSQTYLDEGADDAAAHFVKKTVAFDDEGEQMPALLDIAAGQSANGGCLGIALVRGKRAEIVLADEGHGGSAHGAEVQRPRHVPGAMAN